MKNQWLIFDITTVIGLINAINGSDLDVGVKKIPKNTDAKRMHKPTAAPPFHKCAYFYCAMGDGLTPCIIGNKYARISCYGFLTFTKRGFST